MLHTFMGIFGNAQSLHSVGKIGNTCLLTLFYRVGFVT